jgi:hypothetical protein
VPTTLSVNKWSVDSNYLPFNSPYPSPLPPSGTVFIHLGGASGATPAAGIAQSFGISPIAQESPAVYLGVQTIYECDSFTNAGKTVYNGSKGPTSMIDTLDGNIVYIHAIPGAFSASFNDSPGYPIVQGTSPASASVTESFESYIMYQYGVNSDSSAPNIFVPLSKALAWSWHAGAVRNGTFQWVATASPAPGPPVVSVAAVTAEPTLQYQIPFLANTQMTAVEACQP